MRWEMRDERRERHYQKKQRVEKCLKLLRSIGITAMHDTSLCGLLRVPASYDEYAALVKSGEITSEHVRRIGSGNISLVKPGYRDLLSYVTLLLVM